MKIFVVRAKPHGINREEQFLSGVISIGWPTSMPLDNKNRGELAEILNSKYDMSEIAITMVEQFVNMPIGSIVLSPSYKTRAIHIFQTISAYHYVNELANDNIGNPHVIDVKYLKTVSRTNFSEVLQKALHSAKRTVSNFSKYKNEISNIAFECGDATHSADEHMLRELSSDDDELEVRRTLKELLKSNNEEIRLKAALALLGK